MKEGQEARIRRDHHCRGLCFIGQSARDCLKTTRRVQQYDPQDGSLPYHYQHDIGKRFADARLSDLVIEVGIVATGSVSSVVESH